MKEILKLQQITIDCVDRLIFENMSATVKTGVAFSHCKWDV